MPFNLKADAQVYQVLNLRLSKTASKIMSAAEYHKAASWLPQWTCVRNFQAILTDSKVEALACARREIIATCNVHGFAPEAFEFELDVVPVKLIDGHHRFWMTSSLRTFDFYPVVPTT